MEEYWLSERINLMKGPGGTHLRYEDVGIVY